ncbi:hypothetical protein WR25_11511 [Diploscapter pachys]|uniref:Uncharacterized protein n=1 Tax=Diploscapter pachys TaxID=2018661 RepID=A0A2A2JKH4_9BILA|nr:hypothetical protein WR25_11511 [Diploscapter pachys]
MEAALLSEATGLRTIICNAIRTGNNSRIELLLTSTATQIVDQCLNSEMSDTIPLVIAARYGRLEIVRTLLKMGADPRVVGVVKFDGETIAGTPPLWAAAAAGYLEVVRVLVEEGQADINQPTSTNSTPLRGACYDGLLEIVKSLIEKGADLEIANRHGHTSLMIAAFRNKYEVVKVLLRAGANVSAKTLKGNTALHDAAEGGNLDIVRLLLDAEATLQPDEIGLCPLLTSAICGHEAIVEHLLPFCDSAVKKRDALKLLGCTLIDKKMDVFNGSNFWKRALDIPIPYSEREEFDKIIQSQEILPVYENLPEPHTQEEFSQFEHNLDFIRMLRDPFFGDAIMQLPLNSFLSLSLILTNSL